MLLGESHNSLSQTLLYLVGTAALMSFFIPNAITVLTLLPVLDLLSRAFRDNGDHRVPTLLTLAVLYGANIGGMGSVTGTPTNLLLVGYLQAQDVP
ncbi:SLC13 family permease, partial [Arthrospira platensis SPKY1]|nr:SLC13 family permease [Arthrospira platensis SPKY1]